MKKVLFVATVDSHIIHFHLPYLKWFQEHGYEVHVATNSMSEIPYCDKKHKIEITRSPLKIGNLKAIFHLKKIIKKEKFDIIHCHTPMGGVVTRLAAEEARKKYGTRVVYTAHGFHFFKGAPFINWIIYYPMEKILSYITDCLVTINEEDYFLAAKKFHAKQVEKIHGVGISHNKFLKNITIEEIMEKRKKISLKKEDFVISYVAELNKNKNQIALINAIKELKKYENNVKLVLIGDGKLKKKLEEKIKNENLQNDVLLLGYRKDVAELIKISDLIIATSKREGLPMNILEALFCKIPVIATDIRGHRDLIDSKYLLQEITAKEIKEKMDDIKQNGYQVKIDLSQFTIENVMKEFEEKEIYLTKKIMPIRVLQVIRAMNVGGAETFIMNLYRKIDRNQIQFDFLVSRDGFFDEEIRTLGGRIFKIPYLTDVGPILYKKRLKEFFRTHHEYKMIHSHIDQVSGFILQVANKSGIPIRIAHSHSTRNTNGILGKIYKKYLQRKITKNATDLLACGEDAARWLYPKNFEESKIIKNGIEVEKFQFSIEKREKVRKELNVKESTVLIGHVGRFAKVKNHDFLIEIFQEYHNKNEDSKLILVGEGTLKKEVEEKVEKLGLKDCVLFLGVRMDVDHIYSALDVLVFPSLFEGLSFTLIEAQTAGLPIYMSDRIDSKTKITERVKEISLKETPKQWAEQIEIVPLEKRLGELEKIEESGYDIKKTVKEMERLYMSRKNNI